MANAIHPAGLLGSCARRKDTAGDLPFGPSFAIYSVRVIRPEDALHLPAYNFMSIGRAHTALFRCWMTLWAPAYGRYVKGRLRRQPTGDAPSSAGC